MLSIAFGLFLFTACSVQRPTVADLLAGTWKVKDKMQYEVWEPAGKASLKGYAYRMQAGEQKITETLQIRKLNGQWVYEATVPDQNDGATIRFTLNPDSTTVYSFENTEHDFPQKIQYRKLSETEIEVNVLGENGKGFSYIQERQ